MAISDYTNLKPLTDDDIDEFVALSADTPVVLYFSTTWCAPCKTYGPMLDSYAGAHPEVQMFAADGDDSPEVTDMYGVGAFPVTILVSNGTVVWRHAGDMPEEQIAPAIATALAGAELALHRAPRPELETVTTGTIPPEPSFGAKASVRADEDPLDLEPGQTVTVGDDESLSLVVIADPFNPEASPVSWLERFPRLPIQEAWINGVGVDLPVLESIIALNPAEVNINSLTPISDAAIELIAQSPLKDININAPGFQPEPLSARVQGMIVNGIQVTPNYQSEPKPKVAWTDPSAVEARIVSGERFVVAVQRAHHADTEILSAYVDILGRETVFTSCFDSLELNRRFPLSMEDRAVLFGVESGHVRWRISLPYDEKTFYPADVDSLWESSQGNSLEPLLSRGERAVTSATSGEYISLLSDTGIAADTVRLDNEAKMIPAGWRILREANVFPAFDDEEPEEIRTEGVDELLVWIQSSEPWHASVLPASEELLIISLMSELPIVGLPDVIGRFPQLRMLFADSISDQDRSVIRASHPNLVINGVWPR